MHETRSKLQLAPCTKVEDFLIYPVDIINGVCHPHGLPWGIPTGKEDRSSTPVCLLSFISYLLTLIARGIQRCAVEVDNFHAVVCLGMFS
jgi:hypothetical protein